MLDIDHEYREPLCHKINRQFLNKPTKRSKTADNNNYLFIRNYLGI